MGSFSRRVLGRYRTALLAVSALSAIPQMAFAQTWTGATNSDWNINTNWSTGNVPNGVSQAALLGAGGANQPTLSGASSAQDLSMEGTGNTLQLNGQTLAITEVLALSVGTITGSGTVTVGTGLYVSGGSITGGSTLNVSGTANLTGGSITGAAIINANSFSINSQSTTAAGTTLNANGTFNLSNNTSVGANMTGVGATIINGTATLSGLNTYSGTTTVTGTLRAGAADTFSSNSAHTVSTGGSLLNLNNFNQTIGSLAGAGNVTLGSATLTAGGNNSDTIFSGVVSGTGGLTKTGTGLMRLSGANTYSGATNVDVGNLQAGATNTFSSSSAHTVGASGALDLNNLNQTIGSLAGASGSIIALSSATLTTGGNNTSTTVAGVISGTGGLTKQGTGTMTLSGANTYSGATNVNNGTLQAGASNTFSASSAHTVGASGTLDLNNFNQTVLTLAGAGNVSLGTGTLTVGTVGSGGNTTFSGVLSGTGGLIKDGNGELTLTGANTYSGGTTVLGSKLIGTTTSLQGNITNNSLVVFDQSVNGAYAGVMSGTGFVVKSGTGTVTLTGANTYTGLNNANGTEISGGILQIGDGGTTGSIASHVTNNATLAFNRSDNITFAGTISGTGSLLLAGTGRTTLTGTNTYSGGTTVNNGTVAASSNANLGNAAGGLSFNAGTLRYDAAFDSARGITLNAGGGTFNTNGFDSTLTGNIGGSGGLTKAGLGTLTLGSTLSYTGGTTVTGGVLKLASGIVLPTTGALVLNGGTLETVGNATVPDLSGSGGTVDVGAGTLTVNQNSNTTYGGTLTGTGGVDKTGTGTLILTGTNTYTGPTNVTGGRLAVNGSVTSDVTVASGGNLGGSGTITGDVFNSGTVAPGNSIGTLNVTGTYTQASGSTYQVEVNAQGQSDRINVTGAAVIQSNSTVQVIAESGTYARNTTYTILTATAGITGTYSTVTSNFAFLRPSLSYDAGSVFLTLTQTSNAFASGAQTPNQFAVGTSLDLASPNATGDFLTVIDALATLNTQQGPAALNAISGQNYSSFSSAAVQGAQLFMSNFANQAGGANRKNSSRVALAEACDVACETAVAATWGVWGGAIGGTGTLGGNSNSGTTTYSLGGFAAGIDRAIDPDLRVGVTVGYTSGRQWTSGFSGTGYADTVQLGLYSNFTHEAFYLDGFAGYAYSDNRMQRQIAIPGLAPRVANGSTGINQFFGQVETGYRFDIGGAPEAYITPFVRLQGSTATQNAFSESGAGSLNLNIAAQTTNSLRSVIGAQLGGAMDLGWREKLSAQIKLGWSHEYANTDRPVTASFAGAPAFPFTTYGAAPQRDGIVLGFNAGTAVAERTSVYLRYEGEFSGLDNAQALSAGIRMTW